MESQREKQPTWVHDPGPVVVQTLLCSLHIQACIHCQLEGTAQDLEDVPHPQSAFSEQGLRAQGRAGANG